MIGAEPNLEAPETIVMYVPVSKQIGTYTSCIGGCLLNPRIIYSTQSFLSSICRVSTIIIYSNIVSVCIVGHPNQITSGLSARFNYKVSTDLLTRQIW